MMKSFNNFKNSGVIILTLLAVGFLAGCIGYPPEKRPENYSQAQLNAIQTRYVETDFLTAYRAAIAALQDAGYNVELSDSKIGVAGGKKTISPLNKNQFQRTGAWGVTITLNEESSQRIRVRTSVQYQAYPDGGFLPIVDKPSIDQIWRLMERQVLLVSPLEE